MQQEELVRERRPRIQADGSIRDPACNGGRRRPRVHPNLDPVSVRHELVALEAGEDTHALLAITEILLSNGVFGILIVLHELVELFISPEVRNDFLKALLALAKGVKIEHGLVILKLHVGVMQISQS